MAEIAIEVEGLSKRYRIGASRRRYETLRESLVSTFAAPYRRLRGNKGGPRKQDVWALRDVSLSANWGEVVGVIGPNGAGKSTLLKILSRITRPTSGRARVYGRVGTLLEIGTGFHMELTGRENIFLSGSILGMSRAEIRARFDEIVDFASVERFLDTPVKHYSSGMFLRLGFAVAAHLEPEILLVDEVLAVGDAQFQKKCTGKLRDVAGSGRTVLFVSHNLAAVSALCSRALLLRQGEIEMVGNVQEVCSRYQIGSARTADASLSEREDRRGSGLLRFTRIAIEGEDDSAVVATGGSVRIVLEFELHTEESLGRVHFGLTISDELGRPLFTCSTGYLSHYKSLAAKHRRAVCSIPLLPLAPGAYGILITAYRSREILDEVQDACVLDVGEADFFGNGFLPVTQRHGHTVVRHDWKLETT